MRARRILWCGTLALLISGCQSAPHDSFEASYEALTSGAAAPSLALLAAWDARRDGTFEADRLSGRAWLRFAWHAAAVGRRDDAHAAIAAATAADGRLTLVADALAAALPEAARR